MSLTKVQCTDQRTSPLSPGCQSFSKTQLWEKKCQVITFYHDNIRTFFFGFINHCQAMDFAKMTGRWSSKSDEQKAARVRDNQRRHRARTKAYIQHLEKQLSETQARLQE